MLRNNFISGVYKNTVLNTNILLLSAGRRVSLYRSFTAELKKYFAGSTVIAADANPQYSAVCRMAEKSIRVPYTTDGRYYEQIPELCHKEGIGLIVPTTDFDTNALALLVEDKKLPDYTRAVVSDKELVLKCQDKVLTCTLFSEADVDFMMPLQPDDFEFPLYMKPRYGYNSDSCRVIYEPRDLPAGVLDQEDPDDYIFQYYLDPGIFEEYSVDCYYSQAGQILCAVPRKRIAVRAGEVSKSVTLKNEVFDWVMNHFSRLGGARGAITIQCFVNTETGEIIAGEINPRFAGGVTLSIAAGANMPAWYVEEYLLSKTISPCSDWKENLLMLRYDEDIIVNE